VATFALAPIGAMRKLSRMRIGFVTVGACLMRDRSFEVATLVAALAIHLEVFAEKRKAGLRMVECGGEVRLLP
jgi:hypothetical protein